MRRVSVFGVVPGMRLARSIRGIKGELLLAGGTSLSNAHLRLLKERGCYFVDAEDGLTDDIEIEETLNDEVRHLGVRAIRQVYEFLAQTIDSLDTHSEDSVRRSMDSTGFARATHKQQQINALADTAATIVDQIMSKETTIGLNSIRLHDEYTFQHSVSVAAAGVVVGRDLGWGREDLLRLAEGCMMHDIGKVYIERNVLNKPGKLDEDEMRLVQEHSRLGYETMLKMFGPGILSNHVPYQHHERQDGTGYPRGLVGDNMLPVPGRRTEQGNILPLAQVASVVDVYDALASDRPYRPALPTDMIVPVLQGMAGTQLNAALLDHFLHKLSPYPVGTEVMLSDPAEPKGFKGVVVRQNKEHRARPFVRVLYGPNDDRVTPFELDLSTCPEMKIASTLICNPGALVPLQPGEGGKLLKLAQQYALAEVAKPSLC